MRVLVTGGCGFLGSHVCELFHTLGWDVTALDNLTPYEFLRSGYRNRMARRYNWEYLKKLGVDLVLADIRDFDSLRHLEADYIVHTAAQPTMTLSKEDPRHDMEVNIIGTFNVLELARKLDAPAVLCSTIHVYGNRLNQKLIEEETRFKCSPSCIGEDHPILDGDLTPLHVSKRALELYGLCYIDTYGLDIGIFRLTGMYGPRQFAGMHHGWVSNFIIRTLKRLPIYIFGTDKQVRDILYVSDAARAFKCFYDHRMPGIYNIGGGLKTAISLRETLELIHEITGIPQNIIYKVHRHGDLYYFVCDISKAKDQLGWYPKVMPREGLEKTIRWVQENLSLFEGIA